MAKKGKAKLIPAIEALHANFAGTPAEWIRMEDVLHHTHKRLGRLSWGYTTKAPMKEAMLLERLAARESWMVFPDANQIILNLDGLWPELLVHERHVALTARVFGEIDQRLREDPSHPLHEALMNQSKAVLMRPDVPPGTARSFTQAYYLALLVHRRSVLGVLRGGFELQHGREPSATEAAEIRKMMDKELSRERLKLENKKPSPYLTDEHLVYHAVSYALETGKPTVILSGDYDVAAYFRHLIELLLAHYQSMLIAERYEEDFVPFRPRSIAPEALAGYFAPESAVSIDLADFRSEYPWPSETPTSVPISCITATREHVSEMIFNAETSMDRVFSIKGKTDGMSTDLLAGRNLHAWHVLPEVPQGRGVIATDIRMPLGDNNAGIGMADLLLSIAAIK